ncbi:uncharacterized protein [Bos taurus]|uniref:uncharacterized protein isoform X1 n=1 Tax=Bos taurus TaxID=9913 RepID=UPI0028CBBCB3|nr:uncharacterized protein LOC112446427 isoform X1 [Bos taurus]
MRRTNSFEKTQMLGKIEGGRRMEQQRIRWLDGITDSMNIPPGLALSVLRAPVQRDHILLSKAAPPLPPSRGSQAPGAVFSLAFHRHRSFRRKRTGLLFVHLNKGICLPESGSISREAFFSRGQRDYRKTECDTTA